MSRPEKIEYNRKGRHPIWDGGLLDVEGKKNESLVSLVPVHMAYVARRMFPPPMQYR